MGLWVILRKKAVSEYVAQLVRGLLIFGGVRPQAVTTTVIASLARDVGRGFAYVE